MREQVPGSGRKTLWRSKSDVARWKVCEREVNLSEAPGVNLSEAPGVNLSEAPGVARPCARRESQLCRPPRGQAGPGAHCLGSVLAASQRRECVRVKEAACRGSPSRFCMCF
eukprot:532562-Rhodomonas_salina.2